MEPYYAGYERRYRAVYAAGGSWGFSPDSEELRRALSDWVETMGLHGKQVLEFGCGEGAAGVILSELGCRYHGVELAPSAVEKARARLSEFPGAEVSRLDMVREKVSKPYDAVLDVMALHMLITDGDRMDYLRNIYDSLIPGGPALFYRESHRRDGHEGPVDSLEQWKEITGMDYSGTEPRRARGESGLVTVQLPRLAARARTVAGYRAELTAAGLLVEEIYTTDYSATILARRP